MIYLFDLFGTLAFAISGAFHGVRYQLDLLGLLSLATVTGIAGGIIRDTILGATPPVALIDPLYVLVCLFGGFVVFFAAPKIAKKWDYVMIADCIGLSVFAAIGASKAASLGATPLTIILMAMITACGGGLVRDLLVSEIPSILRRDIYGSAALGGGFAYVLLKAASVEDSITMGVTMAVTCALRASAMRYGLSLPKAKSLSDSRETQSEEE